MDKNKFDNIVAKQIQICKETLEAKGKEYTIEEDRLGQFYKSAVIRGTTPLDALGGKMVKHTTSIYDMIKHSEGIEIEMWEEKIKDSINYLLILKTLVIELLEKTKGDFYDRRPKTAFTIKNDETLEFTKEQGPGRITLGQFGEQGGGKTRTPYDKLTDLAEEIEKEDPEHQ